MFRLVFTSGLFFCATLVAAQSDFQRADSLRRSLASARSDSARSLILSDLAYEYRSLPDSNYAIARRGLTMAEHIHFAEGIASNQLSLSVFYYYASDFVKALEYDLKALSYYQQRPVSRGLGRSHLGLGIIYSMQGNSRLAIRHARLAGRYFEKVGDIEGRLLSLNNAGAEYIQAEKFDSAFSVLNTGIRLAARYRRNHCMIALTGSMAELYFKMHAPMRAEQYIRQSILLNENQNLVLQAYNYNMLAKIQLAEGNIAQAKTSVDAALSIEREQSANDNEPETWRILSEVYVAKRDTKQALVAYKRSVEIERRIFSTQKQKEQLGLLQRFELDEKEHLIKLLEQEKSLTALQVKLKEQELSKQRLLLSGSALILALVIGSMIVIMRQSHWRNQSIRKLQEKNHEIEETARQLDEANRQLEEINQKLALYAQGADSKIENYAFLNSHRLRGPVASMIGLIGLVEEGKINETEVPFVMHALKDEVTKLDKAVFEISRAIE